MRMPQRRMKPPERKERPPKPEVVGEAGTDLGIQQFEDMARKPSPNEGEQMAGRSVWVPERPFNVQNYATNLRAQQSRGPSGGGSAGPPARLGSLKHLRMMMQGRRM